MTEEFHYLRVSRVGTFTVYDEFDCAFKCLNNPSCFSVNVAASKGANDELWCELLSSDKYRNSKEYYGNKSSHHFTINVRTVIFSFLNYCVKDVPFIEIITKDRINTAIYKLAVIGKLYFFSVVALFVLAVPKWRFLCSELQAGHV